MRNNEREIAVFKRLWQQLTKENRQYVAAKAQRAVSYCNMIVTTIVPHKVSADTLYDLISFAGERLDAQNAQREALLKKYETSETESPESQDK